MSNQHPRLIPPRRFLAGHALPWLASLVVALLCLPAPLFGMYVHVEVQQVPLERLLTNLQKQLEQRPDSQELLHHLARAHAMAHASDLAATDTVAAAVGAQGLLRPWFGYEPPPIPFKGREHEKGDPAQLHLDQAIAYYQRVVDLDQDHLVARLGLAWCREQDGRDQDAMAGYRELIRRYSQLPEPGHHYLGREAAAEAAGYLLALLDPAVDAAEIAGLEALRKELRSTTRFITPIAIPLASGLPIEALLQDGAGVAFDLDASGDTLRWPWISPRAAWLAYLAPGTSCVESGLQLLGSRSFLLFFKDGFAALALLDDDGDGAIHGPELAGLVLWNDLDGDGLCRPSEVAAVELWGIRALRYQAFRHPSGHLVASRGVELANGEIRPAVDLVLRPLSR